jgi:cytochrome c556
MIRNAIICLTFVALGTFFAASELNAQSDLREIVQKRKNQMNAMEDAYWPLLDIKKGKSTDLAKGGESAKIMANAMVKALALFPLGTAKGEVLGSGSRARPEIWSNSSEFKAAADALISASLKLAEIAKSGDLELFKAQFQVVEQVCLGCHAFTPSHGGKFKFPM